MKSRSVAHIFLLLAIIIYGACALLVLIRSTPTPVNFIVEKRWVIYNGFCVRPYLHAGRDVTLRLLSSPTDPNDALLTELPRDDPSTFEDDLTLLSHTSASALDEKYLVELLANWRGPISLAVFAQGRYNEEYVLEKIERTLQSLKNPEDASKLAVHIMLERVGKLSCDQSERQLRDESSEDTTFFASYPINTVRNVARLFSATTYIALADSDFFFSAGFYDKILPILRRNVPIGSKRALLYRIFEINEPEALERNHQLSKADLKEIMKLRKGRVFHVREHPHGHVVPNLTQWLRRPESTEPGLFNFTVDLRERYSWEFQFSGLRDVPYFDEAFPYRYHNNVALRWEVCRAGYHLLPIEDLFVYHTLEQNKRGKDDTRLKNRAMNRNRYKFFRAKKAFAARMERLYPETIDDCPELNHD